MAGGYSGGRSLSPNSELCNVGWNHTEELLRGLNALRNAQKLCDVTFIVEERTFKAHRAVLAACSDYFCAMFTGAMREATENEINLNGVSARGFELLLEYVYTSLLELRSDNVEDVLSASAHVQIRAVTDDCSSYLESLLDLENCVEIAALADLYALESLQKKAYRFLCARFEQFVKTADWLRLPWRQLVHLLSNDYPMDCSEERLLEIVLEYCQKTNLAAERTQSIFECMNFKEISQSALDKAASQYDCSLSKAAEEEPQPHNIVKIMQTEAQRQTTTLLSSELSTPKALINSRGMELALVKIGGFEANGLTNEINCYLPTLCKWQVLTVIPHLEQCNHGTAVLGNDLYVVGGSYDSCLKEYIHAFGFRYSPIRNTWRVIASIQADRCRFSLNAVGSDELYAVGGVCDINENESLNQWPHDLAESNCERYIASQNRWEFLPPLPEGRSQHAGVVIADKLYISGGIERVVLDTLWCLDTKTQIWSKLNSMLTPRSDHVLLTFDGKIYACGGWYEDSVTETRMLAETIDVYDVAKDEWSIEAYDPTPRFYSGVAAVKRRIYFVGGLLSTVTLNRASPDVQWYDLDTKRWITDTSWEYPKELWESTCISFYVPRVRDSTSCTWEEETTICSLT